MNRNEVVVSHIQALWRFKMDLIVFLTMDTFLALVAPWRVKETPGFVQGPDGSEGAGLQVIEEGKG